MYEENGRISWSNLFIKGIIVIIFVLFTVWLLSLSNRGISNSLNVLTDNIFVENMDRMKEVGKEYFTVERLPEEIGDVKTLSLAKMYEKKLILELKDKNGNTCSAENSYVSIEKLENEYQMKVFLECGEQSDYIKVIMGCYDYCDTDICEVKKPEEIKNIEYEYSKTTGGSWSDWGKWSEWSKTVVTKNNYRDVETKVVDEKYSYQKDVIKTEYTQDAVCKAIDGYKVVSNKDGKCTYEKTTKDSKNPECPTVSGYTLAKRDGFNCSYTRTTTSSANPECPTVSGYILTGRNGFTCNYSKSNTVSENPICPTVSGYTLTGRNGFTCNYSKTDKQTANPECPAKDGYTVTRDGFTCNYSTSSTSTANPTCPAKSGWSNTGRNGFTCSYSQSYRVAVGKKLVSTCSGCAAQWQTVYETRYNYTTGTATCPSGYSSNGSACVKTTTSTTTGTATCPTGYNRDGNTCVKTTTSATTKNATCPAGYSSNGSACVKTTTSTTTKNATCPTGYSKEGNSCIKYNKLSATREATCPTGYSKEGSSCIKYNVDKKVENAVCPVDQKINAGKCYKDVTHKETVNETRKVTYYRYRLRSYSGGVTDYKWSNSKEDKELLNAGYKLTGKTRKVK